MLAKSGQIFAFLNMVLCEEQHKTTPVSAVLNIVFDSSSTQI